MKISLATVLFVCLLVAAGCAPSGTTLRQGGPVYPPEGTLLRVGGEDSAISGFLLPAKGPYEEENTGISIDIVRSRPGTELVGLERGEVDAVVTMQPLEDLLRMAAEERVTIDPARLRSTEVGTNDIVVLLNRDNRLKKLTRKQLKGIFAGKISNWKQLHGPNRDIVVVWNAAAVAENSLFMKEVLAEKSLTLEPVSVYSFEEVRKVVARTPGAIGLAPAGYVTAGVTAPLAPRYSSPVRMITKGEPSPRLQKLMDILKDMALLQ
jgi:phosphate transport system substrate-binding protein